MDTGKRNGSALLHVLQTDTQRSVKSGCDVREGSSRSSCGSSAGRNDLPAEVWDKIKNHPCYSEEAHHHYARMHVAVAPACNIQCNYCNRKYDCSNESRPGVVSEKLSPEEALRKVMAVAAKVPQSPLDSARLDSPVCV